MLKLPDHLFIDSCEPFDHDRLDARPAGVSRGIGSTLGRANRVFYKTRDYRGRRMKPHTYRVHFGGSFVDFPQRQTANGFAILKRAAGYPDVYVQPIGY